jgi:RNA polymerase sigma factor (sigma-70 family)
VDSRQTEQDEHRQLMEKTQAFLHARLQRSDEADPNAASAPFASESHQPDAQESWDAFYKLYDILIRRFIIARGVRGADVDDCLQEVWTDISNRLTRFQITSEAGLRSWIFTLVRSRATDMFRRKKREASVSVDKSIEDGFDPIGREEDPSARYDQEFDAAVIETLVLKLQSEVSEMNFEIFRLRSLEGIGVSETAATVEVTPEQVRYRHHRTMQKLKTIAGIYLGQVDK